MHQDVIKTMKVNYQHRLLHSLKGVDKGEMLENLRKINLKDIAYWIAQACKNIEQRTESHLEKKKN